MLPSDASEREKRDAAERADRAAVADEQQWRLVLLALFLSERRTIERALQRARTVSEQLRVLAAARRSFAAPDGLFYREWVDKTGPLIEQSVRQAIRQHARETGTTPPTALPPAARRLIDERARVLAAEVGATSAKPIAATEALLRDMVRNPVTGAPPELPPVRVPLASGGGGASLPPARPPLSGAAAFAEEVWAQRLATLEPLLGKTLAAEVISSARRGVAIGAKTETFALSVMRQARSSGKIDERRATTIARTETHGAQRAGEHAAALAAGSTMKLWVATLDDRLRDSHRRCHRQGPIPIEDRFVNGLAYPGERPAPPEEVINCRCVLAYTET